MNGLNTQIVLVEPKTLPYSFFKYIFVNRSDFENGKIEKELITHEQIHCQQYHSLDILIIELIKVFLWFNPLIWLFRKTIQLNHEFLADHKVLSNYNLNDYQNTLLNLVFRNNSSYLASNLNYSLTKKRLVMMTKNYTFSKSIYQKIAAINLFLVLTIVFSFSQNIKHKIDLGNYQNEWWYPILKTQNLEIDSFNIFDKVFETGTKHSIKNRVTTIENAIVIVNSTKDDYIIIKSPLAYHDLDKNTIYAEDGYYEIYNIETKKTKASMKLKDYKITSRDNSKITLVARKQVVE
ncbi:M56 family metallopeptidase [Bacteroidota bacterium]